MALEFDIRQVGDVHVIRCHGRIIDGPEIHSLHSHLHDLLAESQTVILDLSDIQFMDSSGIGALVRLHATAKAGGSILRFCSPSPFVLQVLQFTHLHRIFEIHESEALAVSSFYKSSQPSDQELPATALRILCVDDSPDLLAYLRQLLRGAGYRALTSSNVPDAQLLLKASNTRLVIIGPNFRSAHPDPIQKLRGAGQTAVPFLLLQSDFCTQEARAAGESLLQSVRAQLSSIPSQP